MSDEWTQQGLRAAKSGDRREARRIFAALVRETPDDVMAWWNLANVTDDLEQRSQCLRQILKLDPNHEAARSMLATVRKQVGKPTPARGFARPVADADSTGQVSRPSLVRLEPVPSSQPRVDRRVPMAIVAVLTVLGVVVFGAIFFRPPEPAQVPTATPLPAKGLTLTVQQCVTTGSGVATLVFVNNSEHPLTLLKGVQGEETSLGSLPAGAQQVVETVPGDQVRYSARADDDNTLSGGATIEVPSGNYCTVPIQ